MMKYLSASFLCLLLFPASSFSQFELNLAATTKSSLIADSNAIEAGQSFQVALKLTHPDHWHSYFKHDGIGISESPAVTWTLPAGFTASDLIFPAPEELSFLGLNTYSNTGTCYFLTNITASDNLELGNKIEIKAAASWQICDDKSCVPEDADLTLSLDIADQPAANPEFAAVTEYIQKKIPTTALPDDWKITASEKAGEIELRILGDLPDGLQFFESDHQIDAQKPRTAEVIDGGFAMIGRRNQGNDFQSDPPEPMPRLRGLLYSENPFQGSARHAFWIDVPISEAAAATSSSSSAAGGELGVVMVFVFLILGGLILNLMPCVFPIVGLKIMGFVNQAGEEKSKIKLHGIAFTTGVLLSFLALAAILYPIKSEKSLGAQMAEPWVVFGLIIVFLLLALSMSGVFEIGTRATAVGGKLAHREGLAGSFFSGVLAVVVATPCSAPFLGPAIGAAWKFNGPLFFLALLAMGVGLALPYIVLSFFPALVMKLPRPGAWMESFKQGMAFLLYAAVGYLVWVYSSQIGEEGQKGLGIMLGITVIAFAAWIYGRWGTPGRKKGVRAVAYGLAAVALVAGVFLAKPIAQAAEGGEPKFEWGKWSPEKVEQLVADGKPVYVDFTARWCLTCQSNKATAYTPEVRRLFREKGITVLKADMTVTDPAADKAIHELGRAAIPVNVLYVPGSESPHVTREVLTPGYLTELVEEQIGNE